MISRSAAEYGRGPESHEVAESAGRQARAYVFWIAANPCRASVGWNDVPEGIRTLRTTLHPRGDSTRCVTVREAAVEAAEPQIHRRAGFRIAARLSARVTSLLIAIESERYVAADG